MHSKDTLHVTAKKPDFTTIICPKTLKTLCFMVHHAPRRSMSTILQSCPRDKAPSLMSVSCVSSSRLFDHS